MKESKNKIRENVKVRTTGRKVLVRDPFLKTLKGPAFRLAERRYGSLHSAIQGVHEAKTLADHPSLLNAFSDQLEPRTLQHFVPSPSELSARTPSVSSGNDSANMLVVIKMSL